MPGSPAPVGGERLGHADRGRRTEIRELVRLPDHGGDGVAVDFLESRAPEEVGRRGREEKHPFDARLPAAVEEAFAERATVPPASNRRVDHDGAEERGATVTFETADSHALVAGVTQVQGLAMGLHVGRGKSVSFEARFDVR